MAPLEPSAISTLLSNTTTKSPRESLAIEVLHNLQHQHHWTDLKLFTVSAPLSSTSSTPTTTSPTTTPKSSPFDSPFPTHPRSRSKSPSRSSATFLISGLPPRHSYIHPDLQKRLLKHDIDADESVPVQREWVLPLSLGEKWTLRQFCWVFDGLSERDVVVVKAEGGGGEVVIEWKDVKRVVLGMVGHGGMGGDGTVAYYIMQEGDVKPRQNG